MESTHPAASRGAAYAGARAASVEAGDEAAREAALDAAGLDPARLTVTISRSGSLGTPSLVIRGATYLDENGNPARFSTLEVRP